MPASNRDPYELLGVSPEASDEELRAAYRRLVQLHHPDHNGGSEAATRRFEEIQVAYAKIRVRRERAPRAGTDPPKPKPDPELEARLADLERRVRKAHARSARARRAGARSAARPGPKRPSDEELGYVRTDDSFSKILDELVAKLTGEDARD